MFQIIHTFGFTIILKTNLGLIEMVSIKCNLAHGIQHADCVRPWCATWTPWVFTLTVWNRYVHLEFWSFKQHFLDYMLLYKRNLGPCILEGGNYFSPRIVSFLTFKFKLELVLGIAWRWLQIPKITRVIKCLKNWYFLFIASGIVR